MKVCIEISKMEVCFPNGEKRTLIDYSSGFNRIEVVMAMLKSQIEDVIEEEEEGDNTENKVKEALNRVRNSANTLLPIVERKPLNPADYGY